MGRSPSISDMEQKEDSYRQYLTKLQGELSTQSQAAVDAMGTRISKFYESNGWDNSAFLSGSSFDFMQQSEWSMANVKNIIDAIAKAIFGDGTMPQGVTVTPSNETSAALSEMDNMELYIAAKVFDVLSGIVESFGSATSVTFNSAVKDAPIGNGFHLFVAVSSDSYKSQDFFNNDEIYEYMYAYDIRFSQKEADAEANTTLTKLYEDMITTFTQKVEDLLTQLTNGKLTPEQYQSQEQIYNQLISDAKKKLNALGGSSSNDLRVAV